MDQAKWDELRKKHLDPVDNAAKRIFGTPDGAKVLHALDVVFGGDPTAKDSTGRVDEHATLINVGAARVITYLHKLVERTNEGTGP